MVKECLPVDCSVVMLGEEKRESEEKSPTDDMYYQLQRSVAGVFDIHGSN